ncbi:XYLT [Linum grandiflorum]
MSRGQSKLLKILISLFALNSITIFLYFSFHHHHRLPPAPSFSDVRHLLPLISNRHFLPTPTLSPPHTPPSNSNSTPHSYLKPWPILPSYLPWTRNPNPADFRSCEAYFGNGFTRRVDVLPPVTDTRGWFRCFFSQTLLSSVCEGGRIRMLPDKIVMSRGGETLNEVIGRDENDEMPVFQSGAFQVLGSLRRNQKLVNDMFLGHYLPEGEIGRHTMRQLVSSIEVVDDREFQCDQWIEEPALLVTRFEYANLFHTVTDWYSSYVASKVTDLPYRPHLVFVDGHCRAPLEETWNALFSSIMYAKNFSGSVCFRHVVLVPLGYETALFRGLNEDIFCYGAPGPDLWKNPDDKKTARLSEFGEMIRAAFHFPVNRHGAEKPAWGHNILFIRREDYLAHPRHDGKVQSRLSNEEEVFDAVLKWASDHKECKVNIVNGLFAHMAMKQQVKAIQEASVIIGAHGAGLTHIVSATPKTVILEIVSAEFRRPHFQLIAQWKGLEYHAIYLEESHADPVVVISRLGRIMKSLEC